MFIIWIPDPGLQILVFNSTTYYKLKVRDLALTLLWKFVIIIRESSFEELFENIVNLCI